MEEKIKLKIKNYPVYIGDKLNEQTDKNICKNQIDTIVNFIPSFFLMQVFVDKSSLVN